MCKFATNREDLGQRVTGYIIYNSLTKEFIGQTSKAVKDTLANGDRIYGFILGEDGEIALDKDGFHTTNMMVRSGINTLTPMNEFDSVANVFYIVVAQYKGKGETEYELVNSRYGRMTYPESKVKMLAEFGCIQGGVYIDGKGRLIVCDGVEIVEKTAAEEN